MTPLLDLQAIRIANPLPAVAATSLKLMPAGSEWKACCPFHAERSPSFTIFAGGDKFHCFGCGAGGDVLDFVQRLHGVSLRDAAQMLGSTNLTALQVHRAAPIDKADRVDEAIRIWRNAAPVSGSLAETYLRARRLTLPVPASIRFARLTYGKRGSPHPCLIACVASIENKVVGIQRTFLNASGTGKAAVPKAKLSLGRVRGGAIRLAPAAAELIVCEGLEDGLTLMQELGRSVWVAAGASMLPGMEFPDGVRSIVIGADGDAAGEAAAQKAAEAFSARGLRVRILRPLDGAKDFNEELTGRST